MICIVIDNNYFYNVIECVVNQGMNVSLFYLKTVATPSSTVLCTLEKYIQREYFGKKKIEVSKGHWKFISQHLHQQLDKITHKVILTPSTKM